MSKLQSVMKTYSKANIHRWRKLLKVGGVPCNVLVDNQMDKNNNVYAMLVLNFGHAHNHPKLDTTMSN